MKKILILLFIMVNILPGIYDGRITFYSPNVAEAQYGCTDPSGPGSDGNGGGGFFSWIGSVMGDVGGFIGNVGQAIGDFFTSQSDNSQGGEQFGEELDDYGWSGGNGNYEPEGDPSGMDNWNDLWENPGFGTGLTEWEWDIVNELQQYYYYYYDSGGEAPPPPQKPAKYYVTVGYIPDRYYNGDSIFVMASQDTATLVLRNENPPYLAQQTDMNWKQDNIVKAVNSIYCEPDAAVGESMIRVDSAATKTLIENPYSVYPKPTIIFEKPSNWNGGYGFDDSSHKHSSITSVAKYLPGTETTTINGAPYVVPWCSVTHTSGGQVRIRAVNLSSKAKKDPAFRVNLTSSNPAIILHWAPSLQYTYDQIKNPFSITVIASEWGPNADSLKLIGSIYATTNSGDTIGKMNISCARMVEKNVKFVYVNTGTGFLNTGIHDKQAIINEVGNHAHAQLMRSWRLDNSFSNINMDTMDLTAEYLADTATFHNSTLILNAVKTMFHQKKGIWISDLNEDVETPNSPNKVHVVFVFNYPTSDNTSGIANLGGTVSCFFSTSDKHTFSHEMGHLLNLTHTFPDVNNQGGLVPNYNIPKYSTQNIMDYAPYQGAVQNMFYFCQWVDVY